MDGIAKSILNISAVFCLNRLGVKPTRWLWCWLRSHQLGWFSGFSQKGVKLATLYSSNLFKSVFTSIELNVHIKVTECRRWLIRYTPFKILASVCEIGLLQRIFLKVGWFFGDHGRHIQDCNVLSDTTTGFPITIRLSLPHHCPSVSEQPPLPSRNTIRVSMAVITSPCKEAGECGLY